MTELLCFVEANLSFLLAVLFITNKIDQSIWFTLAFHFTVPIVHVLERFEACYVIGEEDGVCSPIEYLRNTLKVLLPCCIPNLQFYLGVFYFQQERPEFNTDCNLVVFHEFICCHSMHQARRSYATVADDNQLEEMIKLHTWHSRPRSIWHHFTPYLIEWFVSDLIGNLLNFLIAH